MQPSCNAVDRRKGKRKETKRNECSAVQCNIRHALSMLSNPPTPAPTPTPNSPTNACRKAPQTKLPSRTIYSHLLVRLFRSMERLRAHTTFTSSAIYSLSLALARSTTPHHTDSNPGLCTRDFTLAQLPLVLLQPPQRLLAILRQLRSA